jgi:hypothetical protein
MATRRAAWSGDALDPRSGNVLGVLHARGLLGVSDVADARYAAGVQYAERQAKASRLLGAPRGFESRTGGRSLAPDDDAGAIRAERRARAGYLLLGAGRKLVDAALDIPSDELIAWVSARAPALCTLLDLLIAAEGQRT